MPLLQYRYIFDPSEVIYNQDKRILDITTSSNSDSLLRDLITIKRWNKQAEKTAFMLNSSVNIFVGYQ